MSDSRKAKSLYQRLWEAHRDGRGIRLSAHDLERLMFDEALLTRITNAAMDEQDSDAERGHAGKFSTAKTWKELGSE